MAELDPELYTSSAAAFASQVKKFFHNWFGLLVGITARLSNLSTGLRGSVAYLR